MIRGKLNIFEVKDIKRIAPDYDIENWDAKSIFKVLSEYMKPKGFVLYNNEMEWTGEDIYRNYHWLRWNNMVVKCSKRDGNMIIKHVGIQYKHIK